jgi:hypothetical protein
VLFHKVACLPAHLCEKVRQVTAFEVDRRATLPAHQVMPVPVSDGGESLATVIRMNPAYESKLSKQVQGAVDSHQSHGTAVLLRAAADLNRAGVSAILQQGTDDGPAWLGDAVASLAKVSDYLLLSQSTHF